jgi:hypothetical protein
MEYLMAGNAIETAKQENGSKVYFRKYIESSKAPSESELFSEVVKVYPDLAKNTALREVWLSTYKKQATALKLYLGNNKGYNYSRDESNGFMSFIEDIAKSRCGVKTKDNWDPADIYMVKSNKERVIRNKIDSITKSEDEMANIYSLNAYMRELIQSKDLLPVSLKAISKTKQKADLELSNMGKAGKQKQIEFALNGPLKCYANFGTNSKTPTEIDNGEIAGQFMVGDVIVNWQTRNFNMSTARGGVQTDLTPTGKDSGAKIGKASADAIDDFFAKNYNKLGIIRPVNAGKDPHIPEVGKWDATTKKYWIDFHKELKKFKVNKKDIDFGDMKVVYKNKEVSKGSFQQVLDYCIREEQSTRYAAGRLSSKLTCMRWAYAWALIEKKGLMDEWIKTLYYGAKKEFRDTNGPFIKIY